MKKKQSTNLKQILKNNPLVLTSIGILVAFFVGYSVGIESSHDKTLSEQEVQNLEQKINDLKNSEPSLFPQLLTDDDPILGNPNAPVSIIEFSDYQCPFCARFYSETLPLLKEEYIEKGTVNFVYRDFPIERSHPNAMAAAIASECADEQGKFWQYHNILFEKQNMWNKLESTLAISSFKQFADELDLDREIFDSCLDSGKYFDEVNKDLVDGRNNDISGTPGFFIGNEETGYVSLYGAKSFSEFQAIIDKKLNQ